MTDWLWCPKGTQPRVCGHTWGRSGKSQPSPATVATGLGATGNVPPSDRTPGSGPGLHNPALSLWQAPPETASHLYLPFGAPFTSGHNSSRILDLVPLLLKKYFISISPRNNSGFKKSPCHLPGQAQDTRPRTQKGKGRAARERQKAGNQARRDSRSGINGLLRASGLRWGNDRVRF